METVRLSLKQHNLGPLEIQFVKTESVLQKVQPIDTQFGKSETQFVTKRTFCQNSDCHSKWQSMDSELSDC